MKRHHDDLADQLREEAQAMAPGFSESLHERTLAAVRQSRIHQAHAPHSFRLWPLVAGASLAASIVAAVILWQAHLPPKPHPATPTMAVSLPDPGLLLHQSTQPLHQVIAEIDAPDLSTFEQDARNLARYLANQFPTARPNRPADANHQM